MENAGRAAALILHRLYPDGTVVAAVGSGNNGGDALVALRCLTSWGREVAWVPATGKDPDLSLLGGFDVPRLDPGTAPAAFAGAAVLVDGILGTGAGGAPREPAASLIRAMNGSGRPVVALDIPTGVDPTTGEVPGEAVTAAATIMFGWPKTGALFQPGRARCGRLLAVEIGFPPPDPDAFGAALITSDWARTHLPGRAPDAHKNSVGRVLVVAGRKGMTGAAVIAGRSASRAGAGLVRIASDEPGRPIVQTAVPEAIFVQRDDDDATMEALTASDTVLMGPAMGTDRQAGALLERILDGLEDCRCVLDADALTLLAQRPERLEGLGGRFVLTPHPGEMARLTAASASEIAARPMRHARDLAERSGATVLLKGAPSVVAAPGRPVLVNAVGASDQATAGMGDQLGGTVAAFAASTDPRTAAALGLYYGGRAAELLRLGRALVPDDVSGHLAAALRDPGPPAPPADLPFVVFHQPARW